MDVDRNNVIVFTFLHFLHFEGELFSFLFYMGTLDKLIAEQLRSITINGFALTLA